MSTKVKDKWLTAKQIYKDHKSAILSGMLILKNDELRQEILMAMAEKTFEAYKKKVLYEEALDEVSK